MNTLWSERWRETLKREERAHKNWENKFGGQVENDVSKMEEMAKSKRRAELRRLEDEVRQRELELSMLKSKADQIRSTVLDSVPASEAGTPAASRPRTAASNQ
mmetsp:Transcript_44353/g.115264  ORF Transcript_44353/g.115264 Transcript_44353/m.115264 type:complete len:103 (+) Transcript_44353:228-536(+)